LGRGTFIGLGENVQISFIFPTIRTANFSFKSLGLSYFSAVPRWHIISDNSVDEMKIEGVCAMKVTGYSSAENNDLMSAYLCFRDRVLQRKIEREAEAKEVLRRFSGKYTDEILDKVFGLADRDPTGPWFGQMLSTPNRNRLYRCPMAELNILIERLLETGDLRWLGEWRRAGNRGMTAGTATLLMYLYSPDSFNIWLEIPHHRGLSKYRLDFNAKYPKEKSNPEEYTIFYKIFNKTAIAVREENGLVPQAMDWFLWAVDTIKEKPGNRRLREYIEGRRK
jgi:hypothetical protein